MPLRWLHPMQFHHPRIRHNVTRIRPGSLGLSREQTWVSPTRPTGPHRLWSHYRCRPLRPHSRETLRAGRLPFNMKFGQMKQLDLLGQFSRCSIHLSGLEWHCVGQPGAPHAGTAQFLTSICVAQFCVTDQKSNLAGRTFTPPPLHRLRCGHGAPVGEDWPAVLIPQVW